MNTNLPKLTRRNNQSNKFAFETPWLSDPVYSRPPHPLRKNWGDLSLPIFFWGEGGCRIYYINLLLRQYGISVAETQTFLLYKSLTKQTVLQRNLIKQTEKLICLSYFTRNADSMIKDFFPSFLFEMTAIRFWKSLNRWWRITLQCKRALWCNGWNKMKG